ncbi:MAG: WS/DGAT/MGAT family O-acyltransferase [Candidatus Binatia bacterium]
MSHYDRLSALDASFLGIEDGDCHMHVGGVLVFEAGPLRTAEGGIDIERVRRGIASRLHFVPRFRQRLAYVPYERHPVWVDDDRFRLAYHVRHTALPRPGDERTLKRLVGHIMSQPLDRSRPLWEMHFVEGLDGGRFALVSKTHHCMIDGVSGADLMTVILEPVANPEAGEAEPWTPRPRPSEAELSLDALSRRLSQPVEMLRAATEAVRDPRAAFGRLGQGLSAIAETFAPALTPTSETPLNVEVGPHRRFDWTSLRVDEVKAVKKVHGGTLNDVVLATVAGALRKFLDERGVDADRLQVRALVPVSVRARDEQGALGNRVSQLTAPLPVHLDDPLKRLEAVRITMNGLKESKQALGAEVLTAIAEWTAPNLLVQAVRLAERSRPYNLVVTNVPGPQIPLYLLGARMLTTYPVVTLFHQIALVVGLFSYDGGLHWGFTADWEQVPDLHDFVLYVEEAFGELQQAAATAGA